VQFGAFNTRVKDYFDIWQLTGAHSFDGSVLTEAIERTFSHQQRELPADPAGLSPEFASKSEQAWRMFLKRIGHKDSPAFTEVIEENRLFLLPAIAAARGDACPPPDWVPGEGWKGMGMSP